MERISIDTGAVIVAAGSGKRMGAGRNKIWLPLAGKPILEHVLERFAAHPMIGEIVLVANRADEVEVRQFLQASPRPVKVVQGGAERQDSVRAGLAALSDACRYVLVHDAARPFVTAEQISDVAEAARRTDAAVLAVPVKDTIKVVNASGLVESTPPRESLWAVQTPQAFRLSLLREAHLAAQEAGRSGTDDAMLVEWLGHPVTVVPGSYENIKITTADDLWFGEEILRRQKERR